MISETDEADSGGIDQRIPGDMPVRRRRLRNRSILASSGNSTRSSRRLTQTEDSEQAASVRELTENIKAMLRACAGMAVIVIALVAVESSEPWASGATQQHRGVERSADSKGGSDAGVSATVVGSAQEQALHSSSPSFTPGLEHVDLFGDSLGYQAEPYLDMLFTRTHDYRVSNYTYGGTATCDWLSMMARVAAERPQVAVFVFSGNALTPCMDGVNVRSSQYYDLYTNYTEQAIGIFSGVGAHVFLVGTPVDETSVAGWDHLDDIYRQLAEANPLTVTFVDAGASVETATGGFTWTLPCISIEPSCGPGGTDMVRSPDGVHFCPDGTPAARGVTGPCDEYSPGAFRFALAMVTAVTRYAYATPGDKQ